MKGIALDDWAVFAAVADQGGLTPAARALGVSLASVSRALARLEARQGASLFHRNARRLSLSAHGAGLLPAARQLVADAQALEAAAGDAGAAAAGPIRMAAPLDFGRDHLAPLLAPFLAAHPGIRLDLALDDRRTDLVADGHDLVLRIGRLEDSSLRARRLCAVALHAVASPGFAAAHPVRHPADLAALPAFAYAHQRDPARWAFADRTGRRTTVAVQPRALVNNGGAILPLVQAGLGVALLPDFLTHDARTAGRLVALLPGWTPPPIALSLVTPPGGRRPARVTLLIDHLARHLAHPAWARGEDG